MMQTRRRGEEQVWVQDIPWQTGAITMGTRSTVPITKLLTPDTILLCCYLHGGNLACAYCISLDWYATCGVTCIPPPREATG